jgi:hypothetical protein
MNIIYNKALEIIKHYYVVVYPYIGSAFMTGTESPTLKFESAKQEALFLVQNILDAMPSNSPEVHQFNEMMDILREMEYNNNLIKYLEDKP